MTRPISKIITILLSAALAAACDAGFLDVRRNVMNGDGILIINGTVSDSSDESPVEGIRIIFEVFPTKGSGRPLLTQTEYTSSKGVYMIRAEGFSDDVSCTLTAVDEKGIYSDCANRINVTWSGTAYDKSSNTIAVNGCNFHHERR